MTQTHILDTNIISHLMGGHQKFVTKLQNILLSGDNIVFSALSYYEVKCGLQTNTNPSKINLFGQICKKFNIIFLDNLKIFDIASDIYRALNSLGKAGSGLHMDILIAATAIHFSFNVITENARDFQRIQSVESRLAYDTW